MGIGIRLLSLIPGLAPASVAPVVSPAMPPAAISTHDTFAASAHFYVNPAAPETKVYGASGATWLCSPAGDPGAVQRVIAAANGAVPVFAQYAVPGRDHGGPSAGGAGSRDGYFAGVEANARTIGDAPALVVVEPDALPLGLDPSLVKGAVERYRRLAPHAQIYVDAGHAGWKRPAEMARLLVAGGIAQADGFSLNVSNFEWTSKNVAYGDLVVAELAKLDPALASKRFVVDTGRNGGGPGVDKWGLGTWGDPERARGGGPIKNGPLPTMHTGDARAAAFIWVKAPGYGDNRTRPADRFGGTAWVTPDKQPSKGP